MSAKSQLICAWCGPLAVIAFLLGFWVIAGWIPAPSPADSAAAVAQMYRSHTGEIRIGLLVTQFSMAILLPWSISIAAQTRRIEKDRTPIMTYVQIASVGVGTAIIVLMTVAWETAAFRPYETSPQIVQAFNDFGWFIFLFDWIPFAIWPIAVAIPILQDLSASPVYPRWAAYLSFCMALLFFPAGLITFFKNGPFAWNGLFALYIPLLIFLVWLTVMTILTLRAIRHEEAERTQHDVSPAAVQVPNSPAAP